MRILSSLKTFYAISFWLCGKLKRSPGSRSNVKIMNRSTITVLMQAMILLMNRKLAIGIGCRRGTSEQEILTAIDAACKKIAATRQDIGLLASTVVKQDEGGLLAAAHELGVPIYFYENDQLQQMIDRCGLEISPFVKRQIGVGSVCEAAALQASSVKKLILKKEKFSKVTVAIACPDRSRAAQP